MPPNFRSSSMTLLKGPIRRPPTLPLSPTVAILSPCRPPTVLCPLPRAHPLSPISQLPPSSPIVCVCVCVCVCLCRRESARRRTCPRWCFLVWRIDAHRRVNACAQRVWRRRPWRHLEHIFTTFSASDSLVHRVSTRTDCRSCVRSRGFESTYTTTCR